MNEMIILYMAGFRFTPVVLAITGLYGIECPVSLDRSYDDQRAA